jgi:hypothetical protein
LTARFSKHDEIVLLPRLLPDRAGMTSIYAWR